MGRGIAAVAGLLLCCASAQATPRKVCCFKITLTVSGAVDANYTRVEPNDFVGEYRYHWSGAAYGIAHLVGDTLITDGGTAAGCLEEVDGVKDSDGKRLGSEEPDCREQSTSATGNSFS